MTVPFSLLLYGYVGVVGVIAIITAVNIYHLTRFGYFSLGLSIMAVASVAVPVVIIILTFGALVGVNWGDTAPLTLPSVPSVTPNINLLP